MRGPHQCFFEQPAQRIAAVENGEFVPGDAFARRDATISVTISRASSSSLGKLRISIGAPSGFLVNSVLPSRRVIERDDARWQRQDVSGAAEILLEPDLRGPRKVLREAADVGDVRASEAEHRSGHRLRPRRVPGAPALSRRSQVYWARLTSWYSSASTQSNRSAQRVAIGPVMHHGPHWPKQQVSEIGSVGIAQDALILGVDPGRCAQAVGDRPRTRRIGLCDRRSAAAGASPGVTSSSFHLLMRLQTSFRGSRAPVGLVVAAGEVHGFHDALDHAAGVVGIENVEARSQVCHLRLDAQLARAEAVERARSNAAPCSSPRAILMRPVISAAALLVKVTARMRGRLIPQPAIRCATAAVSVLVLPVPAPAMTSVGPVWMAAARCAGVKSSRMLFMSRRAPTSAGPDVGAAPR